MEIDIRGSGPNCTITLGAENDAERHQIAALKRKAKDPRTRADMLERPGSILVLRLETLPKPPEPTYASTEFPTGPAFER